MYRFFQNSGINKNKIYKSLNKKIKMIRSFECTLNERQESFNVHFHCRSVFAPINEEIGKRASTFGEVDGNITYGKWFGMQDANFQRTTLGNKKYKAYKDGSYKIGGLTDVRGKNLSLNTIENTLLPK